MYDGAFFLTIFSLTEVWSGPELASPVGAAPSELLLKGSRDGVGGEGVFTKLHYFQVASLFFHTVYYRHGLFLFPVLYICFFGHSVTDTSGASGSDIKWFRHSSKKVH